MPEPPQPHDIAALRTEYLGPPLDEADVDPDPMVQFARWFEEAVATKVLEPDSMTVATATLDGRPSARVVALRGYDERGFVFYTNDESEKGQELAANPRAALVFHWREVERQVRAFGAVTRVADEEADAYWAGRPLKSRIGAWASRQSVVLKDRAELEARVAEAAERFGAGEIPKPPFWNGYVVRPDEVELWQGRQSRLHDRLRYERIADAGWRIERLSP